MMGRVGPRITRTDRIRRLALATALGGALAAATAGAVGAADEDVAISGFSYSPRQVTVTVGDTVTWTNSDAQAHTASADDGSWDTSSIGNGAAGSVTFSAAGRFPYHCEFHPSMTGTVIVQGGVPATDTLDSARAGSPPSHISPWTVLVAAVTLGGCLVLGLRRFRSS